MQVSFFLNQAITPTETHFEMSSKRYLPNVPNDSQISTRSAIEDLFQVFENDPEFISKGKRLLNKKRKLEQLRTQLNLPGNLTEEDSIKLFQLRERLKAKRRLRTFDCFA